MFFRILRNERGDALIIAMIIAVISAISAVVMMDYTTDLEKNTRRPRVKSMMTAIEAKVREALLAPSSYSGCSLGISGAGGGGRESCSLIHTSVTSLSMKPVTGAACPTSAPCGIDVSVTDYEENKVAAGGNVSRASVKIHYQGTELSLKDIDVVMDIPADVLQGSGNYKCPLTAPKFQGFDADGKIKCGGFPTDAVAGQFVSEINMDSLTFTIFDLPTSAGCPAGQFINHVTWGDGGRAVTPTCMARLNPFTEFVFNPGAAPAAPIYVPNTD